LLKDKLWFFGSANITRNDATDWKEEPNYHSATKEDNYFFKLSYQITNKHKLVGVIAYRNWTYPEVPTPYLTKEATRLWRTKIPNWNIMYTWLISNNTFLELKTAGYHSKDDGLNQYGVSLDNPVHIDLLTGVYSNAPLWPYYAYYSRFQAHASLSHFAEDFLKGDHEFKMGIQYNNGGQGSVCAYSGGKLYYDYGGYPYLLYTQQPFYYGGRVDNLGVFFDDSWKVSNRLTINLGLRYDNYRGNVPSFDVWEGWHRVPGKKTPEKKDLIVWNLISPRIGIAFQLTSDQKTLLKAHYGRYYDPLFVGTYEWPGPNNTDWAAYYWTESGWELYDYVSGSSGWTLLKDLKAPYSDQISIGLEREVLPDLAVGIMGVYKNQKNAIAIENIGGKYDLVPMVSPDNGQTYMVYNQLNIGESVYATTNPEGFGQKYKGIILNLNKRYGKNWLFNSSLTWSRSEGLAANSPSMTDWQMAIIAEAAYRTGKDPNDWTNAKGLMQMDRTWVFKAQFGYNFPWDILASFNYIYMTGRPYTTRVRVYPDQGPQIILASPRDGKKRFKPLNMFDFRLQKTFAFENKIRFSAMVDVYNLFNIKTVTDYENFDKWSEAYLKPISIPPPRRAQIGLKLEF
jgi:outer membrane receptor protein involved in Fe transport